MKTLALEMLITIMVSGSAIAWEGNADVGSVYCYVTEQTNVHTQPNGNIITKLHNGDGVLITEQKRATNGLWDYVMLDTREARARYHSLGWVLDGVLRCPVEGAEK
jgi:hypothetical protein